MSAANHRPYRSITVSLTVTLLLSWLTYRRKDSHVPAAVGAIESE